MPRSASDSMRHHRENAPAQELIDIIHDAVSEVFNRPEGLRGPYLIKNSDSDLYVTNDVTTSRTRHLAQRRRA